LKKEDFAFDLIERKITIEYWKIGIKEDDIFLRCLLRGLICSWDMLGTVAK